MLARQLMWIGWRQQSFSVRMLLIGSWNVWKIQEGAWEHVWSHMRTKFLGFVDRWTTRPIWWCVSTKRRSRSQESEEVRGRFARASDCTWWCVQLLMETEFQSFSCRMLGSKTVWLVLFDEGLICTNLRLDRHGLNVSMDPWHNDEQQ